MMQAGLPLLLATLLHSAACTAQAVGQEEGQLRLVSRVDINGFATGALQAVVNGEYGAVCSQSFGGAEADVACRQLGFLGGSALPLLGQPTRRTGPRYLSDEFRESILQEVAAPFVMGDLGCRGTEERLVDCPAPSADSASLGYDTYDTDSGVTFLQGQCEPVFVACGMAADASEGDVRLMGGEVSADGNSASGVLEVARDGAWGRACSRIGRGRTAAIPFSEGAADVACRQLGFSSGSVAARQEPQSGGTRSIDDDTWRVPVVLVGAGCTGSEATLLDCPGVRLDINIERPQCDITQEVNVVCVNNPSAGTTGAVRLADGQAGPAFEYGRLEVFVNGTWGSVCDRRMFTTSSAQVACMSLGYDGGAPLRFYQPYTNTQAFTEPDENDVLIGGLPVALSEVDCRGDEASITDCPARTSGITRCGFRTPGRTDATVVACANTDTTTDCPAPPPAEASIRLRGGVGTQCDSLHSGFVEIFHLGEWGTVNTGLATLAADVACRQLGFLHGTGVPPDSATPLSGQDAPGMLTWLRSVECRGTEERIADCDLRRGFQRTLNSGPQTVADIVVCRQFAVEAALESVTTPGAVQGDLRLADEVATGPWLSGRLEIFLEGSWSQVCGLGFDGFDADVACRQLGYGAGTANTVRRSVVAENRLSTVEFRGVDGAFGEVGATLVGCQGNEASLLDCGGDSILEGLRSRECREDGDAGLFLSCVASPVEGQEGALRLVDGTSGGGFATGILEVFHAGAWGSVCDGRRMPEPRPFERDDIIMDEYYIGVSNAAADVVCQQLGFDFGAFQNDFSRDRPSPPWVGQLECDGFEDMLNECGEFMFGNTQECEDSQLRLLCSSFGAEERLGEARLVGGRSANASTPAWSYGAMEVHDAFIFTGSCLAGPAASVACRSLGFTTGAPLFVPGPLQAISTPASENSRIQSIQCQGSEQSLQDCEIQGRTEAPFDPFQEDVRVEACSVACSNPTGCTAPRAPAAQGDVRIVPVLNGVRATSTCDEMHFGAVEIFNSGRWGRICAGDPGAAALSSFQMDAAVACRQLGFPFATLLPLGRGNVDQTSASIAWATDVRCTGVEMRLDECIFPEARGSMGALPAEPIAGAPCLDNQQQRFAVVCRMFEIEESDVIR